MDESLASVRSTPARRPSAWRCLGTGVLSLLGLALSMGVQARCEVQSLELPVKMVGSRAIATVGINGTEVPLAVDSGAFFSILTEAAAAQLKLPIRRNFDLRVDGITGRMEAYTTRVDTLQLLKGNIPRVEFVVGGNEPGAGAMGLLGRNLLSFADTEYDLAHGVIRFLFPGDDCAKAGMAYWAGTAPVAEVELLTDARNRKTPALRANVKLNGSEAVALMDTGATTVVSARAAKQAGVAGAALTPAGTLYGAGRGSAKAWTAAFDTFEIGGETVRRNRLPVADFDLRDADMLLGIDFFLSHRIYVSKQQSKMFFTYNGGSVFALDKSDGNARASGADSAASGVQPETADQFARRGAASAARNDLESALADVNRACELDPSSAAFFAQRAAVEQALKRPAKALLDLDTALALDPAQTDARARRAGLRAAAKDREGARADLDILDQTLAPQAQLRLAMSQLYLAFDLPTQALAQLNQWLPAHPQEVKRDVALNRRCWIRARLGVELKEALDDCDDAVDSDAKNPIYLDSRAWVYLRLGKYENAVSDFDRSLEARPAVAGPLYGRGLAKMRLGQTEPGEADLAAARKLQADIEPRLAHAGLPVAAPPKPVETQ